jgi:hypothetical protein
MPAGSGKLLGGQIRAHILKLDIYHIPDVNVLGLFTFAKDVVAPFNARCVVLVYRGGLLLLESWTIQMSQEVQDVASSSGC